MMTLGRRRRYELISCGIRGHVFAGTDAELIRSIDFLVARTCGSSRWFRCLRCDGWYQWQRPLAAQSKYVPSITALELPLRGAPLKQRYILRLIALDRAFHVLLLSALAVTLFFVASRHAVLKRDYSDIVQAFGGPSKPHPVLGRLQNYLAFSPAHLVAAGIGLVAYGLLEATEMVGLWLGKRWAEYLTLLATIVFLPLEIYELSMGVTILRIIAFALNVVVALYLLWAKRLFGVNGGRKALETQRRAAVSPAALSRALEPERPRSA
jgi:uncharacterized membrane protein (DUF2068 family)